MTETTKITARCECGALALDIEGAPVVQLVCHCSDCRAFTGTPSADVAFFQPDSCNAHGQTESTTMKGATGFEKTSYACATCLTPLYATVSALNGAVGVMANRISPFKFEPELHIWTSEKAEGVIIPADMNQSPVGPPKAVADAMVSSFWGKQ